ncbi:MAG TPA: matrixin family metalloprotease [Polyangiaceae bacterium]
MSTRRRDLRRLALAFTTLWLVLAASENAHAYCRTTTCNAKDPTKTCSIDPLTGCVTDGIAVAWRRRCLSFSLDSSNLRLEQVDPILQIVTRAFKAWTTVQCPQSGDVPELSLSHEWGPVLCGHIEYNSAQGNANVITFRDVWPYVSLGDELARTTVTYIVDTGEIMDADIEVNNEVKFATSEEIPALGFDLQSVLTHEAGHFLGVAHSNLRPETVMLTRYEAGENYRSLRADDVNAVCDIYGVQTTTCDFAPLNGFSAECAFDPGSGGWCAAKHPGLARRGAHWVLVLVFAAAVLLRRMKG